MTQVYPMVMLSIAITIAFTVIGQVQVKRGILEVGTSPAKLARLPQFVMDAPTNPRVVFGLACAVVAGVFWTITVSRSDLSFAYPIMSLAIVLVLALSGVMFGKTVVLGRWVGVGIVCLGLFIAARAG